jgi:surfactin synthase thioesterase subunit
MSENLAKRLSERSLMREQLNLLLLPYAGGSPRLYRDWKLRLPSWINPVPVALPGRGMRRAEPLAYTWPDLINRLIPDIRVDRNQPFAIFGHSLGALVGFELAYALQTLWNKPPIWLGVSGCIAPSRRRDQADWLTCSDESFIKELRTLNGTPTEVLDNRELIDLVMPVLRADFHLASSYAYQRRTQLTARMLIIAGVQDREYFASPDNALAWQKETIASSRIEMIDAGHFYIDSHRDTVIRSVVTDLSTSMRAINVRAFRE